jgi:FKBP-type peptidyl-prolyl cis-trans isomerase FkpA
MPYYYNNQKNTMKKISFILLSLALLVIAGCNDVGFKRTKSGLMYKIMSTGNPAPVKRGEWLKMHLTQSVNDSLLGGTYGQAPLYIPADSMPAAYDPREVLSLLRKGDSAVVVMFGDSIVKKQGGLPPFMKSNKDKLIFTFKVLDVFPNDSAKVADETAEQTRVQEQQMKESETKKPQVEKEIEAYLAEKKLNFQKAPGGTYVVVTEPGTEPKADTGTTASVKYRGTLFKTDKVFDQNMDGTKPPYPVRVGTATVVKGWDEGLCYFGKGGKGMLFVPFWQGYGATGPMNTPYATMVFDIEITDVQPSAAPPSPGAPQPPGN